MPSLWIAALRQFNHGAGAWCIPRKGSEEYAKVRAIMGHMKDAKNKPEPEVKAPTPKAPTPKAPTPKAPTPKAPTPKAPTPKAPTPKAPTPKAPMPKAPTPKAKTPGTKLKEFIATAPEEIAGYNYQRKKGGPVIKGEIQKLLGEEAFLNHVEMIFDEIKKQKNPGQKLAAFLYVLRCIEEDLNKDGEFNCSIIGKADEYLKIGVNHVKGQPNAYMLALKMIAVKFPEIIFAPAELGRNEEFKNLKEDKSDEGRKLKMNFLSEYVKTHEGFNIQIEAIPHVINEHITQLFKQAIPQIEYFRLETHFIKGGIHGASKTTFRGSFRYNENYRSKEGKEKIAQLINKTKKVAEITINDVKDKFKAGFLFKIHEMSQVHKAVRKAEHEEKKKEEQAKIAKIRKDVGIVIPEGKAHKLRVLPPAARDGLIAFFAKHENPERDADYLLAKKPAYGVRGFYMWKTKGGTLNVQLA
jgi:hypothetical protein